MRNCHIFNAFCTLSLVATAAWGQNSPPSAALHAIEPAAAEGVEIVYSLHDAEEDAADLRYGLYLYPNERLATVDDIRTYATLIADDQDVTADDGSHTFIETADARTTARYLWTSDQARANRLGFVMFNQVPAGDYYLYLLADDGVNDPVIRVSEQAVRILSPGVATAITDRGWAAVKQDLR